MSKMLTKYAAACAWCGSTRRHVKGWFCSYRRDDFEFAQRTVEAKARVEAGRPLKRYTCAQ